MVLTTQSLKDEDVLMARGLCKINLQLLTLYDHQ